MPVRTRRRCKTIEQHRWRKAARDMRVGYRSKLHDRVGGETGFGMETACEGSQAGVGVGVRWPCVRRFRCHFGNGEYSRVGVCVVRWHGTLDGDTPAVD